MKGDLRNDYYITIRTDLRADNVIRKAHQHSDQACLIAQLKDRIDTMRVPLYDLVSN